MGVRRLVAVVVALGLLAQGCAAFWLGDREGLAPLTTMSWAHGGLLVAVCFLLTLASVWLA